MRKSILLPVAFAVFVTSPVATTPAMAADPCALAEAQYNRAWANYKSVVSNNCFMKSGQMYCRNYAQFQRANATLYAAIARTDRACR